MVAEEAHANQTPLTNPYKQVFQFNFLPYQPSRSPSWMSPIELTSIPREELTPPKEKLGQYPPNHYHELMRYIIV